MRTKLQLFFNWGITFGDPYVIPKKEAKAVAYASKDELEQNILAAHGIDIRRSRRAQHYGSHPAGQQMDDPDDIDGPLLIKV